MGGLQAHRHPVIINEVRTQYDITQYSYYGLGLQLFTLRLQKIRN